MHRKENLRQRVLELYGYGRDWVFFTSQRHNCAHHRTIMKGEQVVHSCQREQAADTLVCHLLELETVKSAVKHLDTCFWQQPRESSGLWDHSIGITSAGVWWDDAASDGGDTQHTWKAQRRILRQILGHFLRQGSVPWQSLIKKEVAALQWYTHQLEWYPAGIQWLPSPVPGWVDSVGLQPAPGWPGPNIGRSLTEQ